MRRVYEIVPLVEIDGMLECVDEGIVVLADEKYCIDDIARVVKGKYNKVSISEFANVEGQIYLCDKEYEIIAYKSISIHTCEC